MLKENNTRANPLYKIVFIFLIILLSVILLYFGKPFLLPLTIAAILAMMVDPLMNRLLGHGIPKWMAISLLTLMLILAGGIVFFLVSKQIGVVSQDWPEIKKKVLSLINNIEQLVQKNFAISTSKQEKSVVQAIPFKDVIMSFIGSFTKFLSTAFMVLVYLILMLMERKTFKRFILKISGNGNSLKAARAIEECIRVSSKFLIGRLIIVAVIIVLYFLGFWIGDVPYPFFLALIAGLLSIIPVFGNIIGGIIACTLAFVSGGATSVIIVLVVMTIGQVIGDYVLTPWILGDAVKLNPFMTIVSVVGFTFLWGVVGAIFALPIMAMLRILMKNIEGTWPFAEFLAGEK